MKIEGTKLLQGSNESGAAGRKQLVELLVWRLPVAVSRSRDKGIIKKDGIVSLEQSGDIVKHIQEAVLARNSLESLGHGSYGFYLE